MAGDKLDESDASFQGWDWAHPNAPKGGGGTGTFRSPRSIGFFDAKSDPFKWRSARLLAQEDILAIGLLHPQSPAARNWVLLAQFASNAVVPPVSLEKISSDMGGFRADELNDALFTVFGEISAKLHDAIDEEANAVVSTILNRKSRIDKAREVYNEAKRVADKVRSEFQDATAKYEDLTKHPSEYKKDLGDAGYAKTLAAAKESYETARKANADAQGKRQKAVSEKIAFEAYLDKKHRDAQPVRLSYIVTAANQYLGYEKGKSDFKQYSRQNSADQRRNGERWSKAKTAVETLVTNPEALDRYVQFRSNNSTKAKLKDGRTRVGGNDFW